MKHALDTNRTIRAEVRSIINFDIRYFGRALDYAIDENAPQDVINTLLGLGASLEEFDEGVRYEYTDTET